MNLTKQIIAQHLVSGVMETFHEIELKIDQTLTQDATGTVAYLQFLQTGVAKIQNELAVSYVDHNTIQSGFENADDHAFLQSVADRYGIIFSKPGNGICHQVHLEQFAKPGKTLLGSDSHTVSNGALGMLCIGAGGQDVAKAMAGRPFTLLMPKVIGIELTGSLRAGVSAKDVILTLLQHFGVSGNVNHVFEYFGEGVASLRVEERFTICNMGAELGVTTSLFPSDAQTKAFLERLGRGSDFIALQHEHPSFDTTYTLDLSTVDVMIAKPYAPDNVVPIAELVGMPVDQVCIGSCTNASFHDLAKAAQMLRGKQVHPNVSLTLSCGSKAVMEQLAQAGYLQDFIVAGARILECACGPCIGMGQAPKAGGVSLRTFNRNFKGRSGTADALVYLASVESATLAAIAGCIQNPIGLTHEDVEACVQPSSEPLLCYPSLEQKPIVYGANIKPLPKSSPLPNQLSTTLLALLPDNVSTDHIIPATAKVLPYRSNLEKLSTFAFSSIAPQLVSKAKQHHGGVVFAGSNYGQGSSREHAALVLVALGIRVVVAQSFARIHRANLINFGILPLVYEDETLRSQVSEDERIEFEFSNLEQEHQLLATTSRGERLKLRHDLSQKELLCIRRGGAL